MPYTVIVYDRREVYGTPNAVSERSRQTVAELDEARDVVRHLRPGYAPTWFGEAGGTSGPLPDGTAIEVQYRTWLEALALTNIVLAGNYPTPSEKRLILAALSR